MSNARSNMSRSNISSEVSSLICTITNKIDTIPENIFQ